MVVVVVEHRRRRPQHICPELLSTRSWGGQTHKKGKPNTPLLELLLLLTQRKGWDGVRPPGRCNETQRNRAPSTGTGWQAGWSNPGRRVPDSDALCPCFHVPLFTSSSTLFSMLPNFTRYSCRRLAGISSNFLATNAGGCHWMFPLFLSLPRTQMFIFLLIKILIFLFSLFFLTLFTRSPYSTPRAFVACPSFYCPPWTSLPFFFLRLLCRGTFVSRGKASLRATVPLRVQRNLNDAHTGF